ncbi:hypothetical protein ACOMHN_055962 [Nucella lapillus]
MDSPSERPQSPVAEEHSGEYYYLKALSYLAVSADSGSSPRPCSCLHCPSSEDDKLDDDHFSTGFRPGLALEDHHGYNASGETNSQYSASPPTSSDHFPDDKNGARRKSLQVGEGSDASRKPSIKRKMSDGHVHWADEFQKDLTRCRPRKAYTRHPSIQVAQIKPILKANPEDGEEN